MGEFEPQSEGSKPMYAMVDIPGRGKGLVAIENIPKGTRILSERPVITTPEHPREEEWLKTHVSQQVSSLSEHERQAFFSMHNLYPYQNVAEQTFGIIRTNGLPIEAKGIEAGIFLEACRINHACDNNAQKNWNERIERHTIHALRDIPKGEEITIYYLGLHSSRDVRQRKLQEKFGFMCSCCLCSLPAAQSEEDDARLERIDNLDDRIGTEGMRFNFSLQTLRLADERIRLCMKQGPGFSTVARTYLDAAQITIANGDLARGRIFARRAVDHWRIANGTDSKEVVEYSPLVKNPATLSLHGLSMKWKTLVDEAPEEVPTNDFEDWLWRRETSTGLEQPGQLVGLRNRAVFAGFDTLPNSHSVDMEFYENVHGTYRPTRHWCFLGEIVECITLHHLELQLMDVDGKRVPLHFYTDGRGRELEHAQTQKGHTVAVLYAERRRFMYSEPGIRHEDPHMLRIFPVTLKELLDLNDRVHDSFGSVDAVRTCHGCGKKSASAKKCGRCAAFWYCNEGCQKAGWTDKGHKADCKILRNEELRKFILFNWNKIASEVRFPLPT